MGGVMPGLRGLARAAEEQLNRALLAGGAERDGLVTLFFHTLAPDGTAFPRVPFDPYQPLTPSTLRRIVDLLRAASYAFVGPDEVARGLPPGRHAWLTFDDGYANNLALADPSVRGGAPVTVFVSTGHVETGEAFWFDALWRGCRERGVAPDEHARRRDGLKRLAPDAVRAALREAFGPAILEPEGDLDRPMTPDELTAFARAPGVSIGNHTRDHAILPVLAREAARAQIERAQTDLARWLGRAPGAIAYPNGDCDGATVAMARAAGLTVGVTTRFGRARTPPVDPMRLPRFALSEGHPRSIEAQVRRVRVPLSPSAALQALSERAGARDRSAAAPGR